MCDWITHEHPALFAGMLIPITLVVELRTALEKFLNQEVGFTTHDGVRSASKDKQPWVSTQQRGDYRQEKMTGRCECEAGTSSAAGVWMAVRD